MFTIAAQRLARGLDGRVTGLPGSAANPFFVVRGNVVGLPGKAAMNSLAVPLM